jgi:molybdate transport system ATP-binding protein
MPNHIGIWLSDTCTTDTVLTAIKTGQINLDNNNHIALEVTQISPKGFASYLNQAHRFGSSVFSLHANTELIQHSSGEQKKLYLDYILAQNPAVLLLDRPFDYLDTASVAWYQNKIIQLAKHCQIIQLLYRQHEQLPFIHKTVNFGTKKEPTAMVWNQIPLPLQSLLPPSGPLIQLQNVQVQYQNKPILNNINWTIRPGDYWLLCGQNGAGKSTLLSMILGDNPKAYGQDITLFGQKKGSGQSVWELKKLIGYFNPNMVQLFERMTTALHMVTAGIHDSIGLYTLPSERQLRVAQQWLALIGMAPLAKTYFHRLSEGQQRLLLLARAMIKHPPLLLLDEPCTSLDDENTAKITSLINHFATNSSSTVVFVSHRLEPGLQPRQIFELRPGPLGATGGIRL